MCLWCLRAGGADTAKRAQRDSGMLCGLARKAVRGALLR